MKIKKLGAGYYNIIGFVETINIVKMYHEDDKRVYWYIEIDSCADDLLDSKKECVSCIDELIKMNIIHII